MESAEDLHRRYVAERLESILEQVQKTNGRLQRAEIAIAILQWGYGLGAAVAAAWFFTVFNRTP